MSVEAKAVSSNKSRLFSLDTWAALLIRAGVFKHIPW